MVPWALLRAKCDQRIRTCNIPTRGRRHLARAAAAAAARVLCARARAHAGPVLVVADLVQDRVCVRLRHNGKGNLHVTRAKSGSEQDDSKHCQVSVNTL